MKFPIAGLGGDEFWCEQDFQPTGKASRGYLDHHPQLDELYVDSEGNQYRKRLKETRPPGPFLLSIQRFLGSKVSVNRTLEPLPKKMSLDDFKAKAIRCLRKRRDMFEEEGVSVDRLAKIILSMQSHEEIIRWWLERSKR
jgi:hypothetical protein